MQTFSQTISELQNMRFFANAQNDNKYKISYIYMNDKKRKISYIHMNDKKRKIS